MNLLPFEEGVGTFTYCQPPNIGHPEESNLQFVHVNDTKVHTEKGSNIFSFFFLFLYTFWECIQPFILYLSEHK